MATTITGNKSLTYWPRITEISALLKRKLCDFSTFPSIPMLTSYVPDMHFNCSSHFKQSHEIYV
jgi:hypothetical protein